MSGETTRGRTDRASRDISASPQAVYRAFVDGDAWTAWLPPQGMTGRIEAFDARPGGHYRLTLTYDDPGDAAHGKTSDGADVVEGRFAEFVADEKVVHLVTFQSDDPAFAGEMRMTWHVSPRPNGARATFTCENVPEGISAEDHDAGLRSTLENLARFVEGNY